MNAELRTVEVQELECQVCERLGRKSKWFPKIDSEKGTAPEPKTCPNPKCKRKDWKKQA